nr:hypothetical protein [Tanacetum cinerariifolium]
MMKAYTERMNQQREHEALLTAQREQELREQEQAAQREQELLAQKQAAQEKEEPPQNSNFRQLIRDIECDVPINDESSPIFMTFSNPLFDCNDDFTSSDDKSLSNEDVLMENFKIYSNPFFDDEEIISTKIDEADFDLEEEIRSVENLSYDNSSPRMQKLLIRCLSLSLSLSPIPFEDSDSHIEEIDLFLATDDLMPRGIENDDYDSEGDIYFLEGLLSNDPLPLPKNESSNFDHHDDPSFPRPPPEPPDVEVFFDFEPDTSVLTAKVVKGISEHYVLMPNIFPTLPTLDPDWTSHLIIIPSNLETRFLIQEYSLKSNLRDFYHGKNFLFHSSVIL